MAETNEYIKSRLALCMESNCFSKVRMIEYYLATGLLSINSYAELTLNKCSRMQVEKIGYESFVLSSSLLK
ncbi:hypothetical protein [uncultured Phocaeicola sp.]|uniref:hypothetical protein n=1 Tax=uncultured Phocaeicola sp. TaxID=990718 RepID=UPI002587B2B7|nr:hypothetical protein [uncultured Phocaeicola sp.]